MHLQSKIYDSNGWPIGTAKNGWRLICMTGKCVLPRVLASNKVYL